MSSYKAMVHAVRETEKAADLMRLLREAFEDGDFQGVYDKISPIISSLTRLRDDVRQIDPDIVRRGPGRSAKPRPQE